MSNSDTPSTAAAVYVRISEDHQDGAGVERQEQACRDLADRLGLTVTAVYSDNNISAYSGKHRPGFVALQDAMAAGEVVAVLAYSPDRVSRDVIEAETFKMGAKIAGVRLVYVLGGELDLEDPNAALFSTMSAAVSRWESAVKSRRVGAAARQRALSGRPPHGGRRYGYSVDPDTGDWQVLEHEARAYRETVENVIAGASVRSQVQRLNALGPDYYAPERKGKRNRWSSTTLRRTLMRKDAAGLVRFRDEEFPDVQAQWPPIITLEQHRAIVAILTDPSRRKGKTGGPPKYLGTHLYVCGTCGGTLVSWHYSAGPGGEPTKAYQCRNADPARHGAPAKRSRHVAIRMKLVDDIVTAAVVQRLRSPDVQNRVAAARSTTVDVPGLLATRSALQVELAEVGEAIGRGDLTVSQGAAASRGIQSRLDQVARELESADGAGVVVDVAQAVLDPAGWWETAGLEQRRAVLDALAVVTVNTTTVRGGTFDPRRVQIEWRV